MTTKIVPFTKQRQPDAYYHGVPIYWDAPHTNNSASTGREYGADKTGEPHIPASPATGDAPLERSWAAATASGVDLTPGGRVIPLIEIYGLTDPRTGEVRYVGKAVCAQKRLKSHLRDARRRRTPVYDWINKLGRLGLTPGVVVLVRCEPEAWPDTERRIIAEYRASGHLLNVADGGDEPHCPVEVRRENGRRNARARNPVFHELLRWLGSEIRFFRLRGREETAAKMEKAQRVMQGLDAEQRERFVELWQQRQAQ